MTEATGAVNAASRYNALDVERNPFLIRARDYAALTIPGLLPPLGSTGATVLPEPFQSLGADGVNNLASKLMLVLFPPGSSCFRFRMADDIAEEAEDAGATEEAEEGLAKAERRVTNRMESKNNRSARFEVLQHLLVTGNAVVHVMPDGREKFFPLDRFVVSRDLDDNLLEIVTKEPIARESLPANILALLDGEDQTNEPTPSDETGPGKSTIDVYTWIKRNGNRWTVRQEVQNKIVPGAGSYPMDAVPWLHVRWRKVPGQAYGRSRCEEYGGDLRSLEGLTKAILKYAAACAKIIFAVRPGASTNPEDAMNAESGDFIEGAKDDFSAIQIDKFADFQVAKAVHDQIQQRLQRAFLLAAAVQRDAERVTAEEIRTMIGQLEEAFGGQYAMLSEDYQRPLVVVHVAQMRKKGELKFNDKVVSPQIVTGLEGLGRNTDLNKLDTFIAGIAQVFGPQVMPTYVNVGEYMRRRATALGIDGTNLILTDQQVQQNQQDQQKAELTKQVAPNLVQAGAAAAQNGMQQGGSPMMTPQQ